MIELSQDITANGITQTMDPHLGVKPVLSIYQLSINPFARVTFEKYVDIPTDSGLMRHYAFSIDSSLVDMGDGPEWIPVRTVDELGRAVSAGTAESLAQSFLQDTINEAATYFKTSEDPLKNLSVDVEDMQGRGGALHPETRVMVEKMLADKNRHGRRTKH